MTSVISETNIFPSPILPVCADFVMAREGGFELRVGHDDLDLQLGQEVDDVFGAAIEFGVAALAAEALGLENRHALQANAVKRFLHFIELEGL